jgi:hypothetical protein
MNYFLNKRTRKFWDEFSAKYLKLNDSAKKYIDKKYNKMFKKSDRVLGVLCRGTDYINLKPFRHPVQPSPEEVILKTRDIIKKYNCNKVFLATEDAEINRLFQKEFGKMLIYNKTHLYERTEKKYLSDISDFKEKDNYIKGLEYLTNIVILSKCNCFIAGRTSGSVGVLLFKHNFEYMYFWDKGRYKFFPFIHFPNKQK